jgi:hypothetical protein
MREDLPQARQVRESRVNANRCYQCNGHFGLIRRRFALKQFCSTQCLNKYKASTDRKAVRLKDWADFLTRKPRA